MRAGFVRIAVMFFALSLLFSSLTLSNAESYNDGRFTTYINMGDNAVRNNYIVPNMFRQDAPFTNMERFPLVVSGGTEYVPLSMFILYSYIEVRYNGFDENFYLVNNRNGNYISFNISQGVAYNHNGELMKTEIKLFHNTRYIPAKKVAENLGMKWETYDNPLDGIYACRISSGSSAYTLPDLLAPYLEELFGMEEPDNNPDGNGETDTPSLEQKPDVSDSKDDKKPEKDPDKKPETDKKPEPPAKEPDPLEKLMPRRLSMCFTGIGTDLQKKSDALYAVAVSGAKASFSLTNEDIIKNPSAIRSLYVSGHSLFVTAEPDFAEIQEKNLGLSENELCTLYAEEFIRCLEKANTALYHTLKFKTRICTLPYGLDGFALSKEFSDKIKNAGYIVYEPTVSSGDFPGSTLGAYGISSRVKNKLTGSGAGESFDVKALFSVSGKTYYYVTDIASLVNKYKNLSFFIPTEYDLLNG